MTWAVRAGSTRLVFTPRPPLTVPACIQGSSMNRLAPRQWANKSSEIKRTGPEIGGFVRVKF